jgi:RHS repeat-associated protein
MAKRRNTNKTLATETATTTRKYPRYAVVGLLVAAIVGVGFTAYAANTMLRGRVSITKYLAPIKADRSASPTAATPTPAAPKQSAGNSDLVEKYGSAATSPGVAAAIRQVKPVATEVGAQEAANVSEALQHGHWRPGANPMMAIMYGYVPPGMDPMTASMLSRSLPKLPRMPQQMSPEQMAGEPADPMTSIMPPDPSPVEPFSYKPRPGSVAEANQQFLEQYMRERFGPVSVPPLHVDHAWLAEHGRKTATGWVVDHDGSIREMTDSSGNIVAEYAYDPFGVTTKLQGSMESDFGFAHMYRHQRSGLYLTKFRAYSPVLGRWLTRDPLGEAAGSNLYAYARNNPINFRDPLGLKIIVSDPASAADLAANRAEMGPVIDALDASPLPVFIVPNYTGDTHTDPLANTLVPGAINDWMFNPSDYTGSQNIGTGVGSIISFDRSQRNPRGTCPPRANLGHELGHALGLMYGIQADVIGRPSAGTTPPGEAWSMDLENAIRINSGANYAPDYMPAIHGFLR